MKFRLTLLVVCLVLLWLGGSDVLLYVQNPAPVPVVLETLQPGDPPADWLTIQGGQLDLKEAISTSGGLEITALLVPLVFPTQGQPDPGDPILVLLETHDPALLQHFQTYHLGLQTEAAQSAYLKEHWDTFYARTDQTGLVITGAVADSNRKKLFELATDTGMQVADDVLFLSHGAQPTLWKGLFMLCVGLAGLAKATLRWKR